MDPKLFELLIKPLTHLERTANSPRNTKGMSPEDYEDTCRLVANPVTQACPDCGLIVEDRRVHLYLKVYATGTRATVRRCQADGKSCSRMREKTVVKKVRGPYKKRTKDSINLDDYTQPICPHLDEKTK